MFQSYDDFLAHSPMTELVIIPYVHLSADFKARTGFS